jgi:hypothetical protein
MSKRRDDRGVPIPQGDEPQPIDRRKILRRAGIIGLATVGLAGIRDLTGTSPAQAAGKPVQRMSPGTPVKLANGKTAYVTAPGQSRPRGMSPDCSCNLYGRFVWCKGCCGGCPHGWCCYDVYTVSGYANTYCVQQSCGCCNFTACIEYAC